MIFNFFKPKPTLRDLIPLGFVDIHSHILPGIDDGATDLKNSIELIEKMKELGFSKIIGTPHTYPGVHNNTAESIKKSYIKLNNSINLEVKLKYASEYMMDDSLIKKAREKKLLCLKDNIVLVEMSYIGAPINLYNIIYELRVNDYIPLLAHPERYLFVTKDFKEFFKMKKAGCLFQANLLSSTEYYGKHVSKTLNKLLKNNLIDYVGSDIHSERHINAFNRRVVIDKIKLFEQSIVRNRELW